jgi:hypothetical protein
MDPMPSKTGIAPILTKIPFHFEDEDLIDLKTPIFVPFNSNTFSNNEHDSSFRCYGAWDQSAQPSSPRKKCAEPAASETGLLKGPKDPKPWNWDIASYVHDRDVTLKQYINKNMIAQDSKMGFETHLVHGLNDRFFLDEKKTKMVYLLKSNPYMAIADENQQWASLKVQLAGNYLYIRNEFTENGLLTQPRFRPSVGTLTNPDDPLERARFIRLFDEKTFFESHKLTGEQYPSSEESVTIRRESTLKRLKKQKPEKNTTHNKVMRDDQNGSPGKSSAPVSPSTLMSKLNVASQTPPAKKGGAEYPFVHYTEESWKSLSGDDSLKHYFDVRKIPDKKHKSSRIKNGCSVDITTWKDLVQQDNDHIARLKREHSFRNEHSF